MAINKKGQMGMFFLFMIGVVMFIIGLSLSSVLVSSNNQVRTNMDCSNTTISTDRKVTCGVVDVIAPLVIGTIFGLAGLAFGAKLTGYI